MKTSLVEPAYEPLRAWALHPSCMRPPGLACILRGGITTWMRDTQPLLAAHASELPPARSFSTPLSTIVAAMIVEVCQ